MLLCSVLLVLGQGSEGAGLPQKDVELQEKYENFFHLVDSFLWDSEDSESRMYRRGKLVLSDSDSPHHLTTRLHENEEAQDPDCLQ